jgi:hypothetical protein
MRQSLGQRSIRGNARAIIVLAILMGLIGAIPLQFRSHAFVGDNAQLAGDKHTVSQGLEFYDIRLDKSDEGLQSRMQFRQKAGWDSSDASRAQTAIHSAEAELRQNVPDLSIEYGPELGIAHIVGTDVLKKGSFLTEALGTNRDARESLVRGFLLQNKELYGLTAQQVGELRTFANYTNPAGNLSFVELAQEINGIPVFMGELRAVIARNGEIARTVNWDSIDFLCEFDKG